MTQLHTIGTHATTVAAVGGMTHVTYHQTVVVRFNHEHIILNSGGYRTATTKTRMNQASNQFDLGYLRPTILGASGSRDGGPIQAPRSHDGRGVAQAHRETHELARRGSGHDFRQDSVG